MDVLTTLLLSKAKNGGGTSLDGYTLEFNGNGCEYWIATLEGVKHVASGNSETVNYLVEKNVQIPIMFVVTELSVSEIELTDNNAKSDSTRFAYRSGNFVYLSTITDNGASISITVR